MAKCSANVAENVSSSKAVGRFDFSFEDDDFKDMSKDMACATCYGCQTPGWKALPTKTNPDAYRMSLHLCKVSTFCGYVGSGFQLQLMRK